MDAVSFREMALEDLLDAFASTDPVPGGGSAAALAGAVGTSLLLMVAGIPKTKTGAPEETADLAEASSRLHPLREQLLELVDRDSDAYTQVMDALKLPKTSDAEKAARKQAIDAATRAATETPLDTMRACQQALRGAVIVASNGSRRATSDVGVGVELLLAALRGARLNVDINLSTLEDAAYVARTTEEANELVNDAERDAERARRALTG
jgi:glutamate formiminotransferase/formiminotetrahydrofolate cyclodeaminase